MKDDLEVSTVPTRTMAQLAVVADKLSSAHAFEEYRLRVSENTRDRQEFDLTAFENYLYSRDVAVPEGLSLYLDAKAWRGISYGVVDGFVKWMSNEGESIGTMNVRLSTIKTYVGLAEKCGVVSRETLDSIRDIHGYRHIEGLRLDERRGLTRIGDKKAVPVSLNPEQVETMRRRPRTTVGIRDTLILDLLADLGLRCGEAVALKVEHIDQAQGLLTFYREKVHLTQIHNLNERLNASLAAYLALPGAPTVGQLLRATTKDGKLSRPLKNHGLAKRIQTMGEGIGIPNLSPHDLRHYWATQAARNKTPIDRLQNAGGWKSPAMPLRYIEKTKIANEGVILGPSPDSQ